MALDGGHFLAGFSRGGSKGGHGRHGGRQRLAAPGSKAAPIPGVGPLGVSSPTSIHIPSARFGIVVDVAG